MPNLVISYCSKLAESVQATHHSFNRRIKGSSYPSLRFYPFHGAVSGNTHILLSLAPDLKLQKIVICEVSA